MKIGSLKMLRVGTLIMGWVLLAGVLLSILGQYSLYRQGQSDFSGNFLRAASQFAFASSLMVTFESEVA